MIEESLAEDGIAWTDVPVVGEFLFAQGLIDADGNDILVETQEEQPAEEPTPIPSETPEDTPQPTETDTPVDTAEPTDIIPTGL